MVKLDKSPSAGSTKGHLWFSTQSSFRKAILFSSLIIKCPVLNSFFVCKNCKMQKFLCFPSLMLFNFVFFMCNAQRHSLSFYLFFLQSLLFLMLLKNDTLAHSNLSLHKWQRVKKRKSEKRNRKHFVSQLRTALKLRSCLGSQWASGFLLNPLLDLFQTGSHWVYLPSGKMWNS